VPLAAKPKFGDYFDAWNSSSTGHQKAENRLGGSIGWRESRTMKLGSQLKSGTGGGKRVADMVGAGSDDWDENAKALIPKAVRERAKTSVWDILSASSQRTGLDKKTVDYAGLNQKDESIKQQDINETRRNGGMFKGLTVYINGSTYPLISDHKLKYLLVENGANLSIHLGRNQVTHAIIGKPAGTEGRGGASGGLAATKIQKEITRVWGRGIKYVGVEWVLESMKAGRRLPETQFSSLKVASKGQQSVYGMYKKHRETVQASNMPWVPDLAE